jgi:hypothetical protein
MRTRPLKFLLNYFNLRTLGTCPFLLLSDSISLRNTSYSILLNSFNLGP